MSVAFSADGKTVVSGSHDKTIELWAIGSEQLWDVSARLKAVCITGHAKSVSSIAFSPDGRFFASGSNDATVKLWDVKNNAVLATLVSLSRDEWVVATPDGRFDTNNLVDRVAGLRWVIRTEVFEELPLDLLTRKFYEPRLLPRLLANDTFKEVSRLDSINRIQPKVKITDVRKDGPATATVTVEVESVNRTYQRAQNPFVESGAKDLRVFVAGQLVGYRDGDLLRQQLKAISGCTSVGHNIRKCRVVFEHIKLPPQQGVNEVEFSTYAFNTSDVKSETSRFRFKFTQDPSPRKDYLY